MMDGFSIIFTDGEYSIHYLSISSSLSEIMLDSDNHISNYIIIIQYI